MTEQELIMNFPITVYGNLEKYNDTISKGRCRIFYKGRNRNGTFITDEFAEKLLSSAPYTPVKGIYDAEEEGDFLDHGQKRSEGRIYGIVPENPNITWEKHLDEDGVEREYACLDVLYFTALYPEANEICGKGQSMELYRDSVKGEWKILDGARTYVYSDGCFLGLQVLGDAVEPCFEGAAFFSLQDLVQQLTERLNSYNHKQGGNTMPTITFKISDGQKFEFLHSLLNPNFNEAGGWTLECGICEVYDNYAVVRNYNENTFERVYYTKNDETDSLEITNREQCFIVDVNQLEKAALAAVHAINGGTYELIDEKFNSLNAEVDTLTTQNSEFSRKIEEQENTISTLTTERDAVRIELDSAHTECTELHSKVEALQTSYDEANTQLNELVSYKKAVEDEAKKKVISNYSAQLPAEVIDSYLNNLDKFNDLEELDMKLTYELKKVRPQLFSLNPESEPLYIPKGNENTSGLNEILSRYEKK